MKKKFGNFGWLGSPEALGAFLLAAALSWAPGPALAQQEPPLTDFSLEQNSSQSGSSAIDSSALAEDEAAFLEMFFGETEPEVPLPPTASSQPAPSAAPEPPAPAATEPPAPAPSPPPEPAPPAAAGQSQAQASAPAPAEPQSVGGQLPKPLWDNPPSSSRLGQGPAPGSGSSEGRWLQLEVGQSDSGGDLAAPLNEDSRSGSVSTLPTASGRLDAGEAGEPSRGEPVTDRQQLRELFADMLPPVNRDSRALAQAGAGAGAASGDGEQAQPAKQEPRSAILKAGGLLNAERQFGSAGILPPLTPQEGETAAPPAAKQDPPPAKSKPSPVQEPEKKTASAPAPGRQASAAEKKAEAPSRRAGGSASSAAAASRVPKGDLMIINATGNENIGQVYGSVLRKIGYNVISVGQRLGSSPTGGGTLIKYRPGAYSQAQAVSRHLPGRKFMLQAASDEILAADILIVLN